MSRLGFLVLLAALTLAVAGCDSRSKSSTAADDAGW